MRERFYTNVKPNPDTGCHEWASTKKPDGYGLFTNNYVTRRAHRVAWELVNGPIPEGLWVLHHCDNPGCVNPDHLFLGTHNDNVADQKRKGRTVTGTKNGRAKLTPTQVAYVRSSENSHEGLARELGVTPTAIRHIRNGRNWRKH